MLHLAIGYNSIRRHEESVYVLQEFLRLVQSERIDIGVAAPQKLCMVAVCYNNLAVRIVLLMFSSANVAIH